MVRVATRVWSFAVAAAALVFQVSVTHATPMMFDFVGSGGVSVWMTSNPIQSPKVISNRIAIENVPVGVTSPGVGVYSYTTVIVGMEGQLYEGGSGDIMIGRGFTGFPGVADMSDVYTVTGLVMTEQAGEPITLTLVIMDPTLQMAANTVVTATTPVVDGMSNLAAVPRLISATTVLEQGLKQGRGYYQLEGRDSNVITGTIMAIMDKTQQAISEPSSLLLAAFGFAALGVGARVYRRKH